MRQSIAIFCIVFVAAAIAFAKIPVEKELTYKATTVDECIHERECVWYAFEKLVSRTDLGPGYKNTLKKWQKPIRIRVVGDNTGDYQKEVLASIEKVSPYFPQKITMESTYDVLVFFSEDFEKDLKKYNPLFKKILKSNVIEESFASPDALGAECAGLNFTNQNQEIIVSILFIPTNTFKRKVCIETETFLMLGLAREIPDFPFSISNLELENPSEMTALDFLLIKILYDPKFESGAPLDSIKPVFDEVYPDALRFVTNFRSVMGN